MNKQKKFNQQNSKLILEELEERRLFSGGIEGLIVSDLDSEAQAIYADLDTSKAQTDSTSDQTSASAAEEQTQEIVFVDAGVDNYQQLVDDLRNNADTSRNIEVVVLEREQDGIEQISNLLQDRDDLDAIHIISHGSDGNIELGNTSLNSETLQDNNLSIALWANSFAETGDILIYGCNLVETAIGQSLVSELSALTLADVAASDDVTGSVAQGGDWNLEYATGSIEASTVLDDGVSLEQTLGVVSIQDPWTNLAVSTDRSTTISENHTVTAAPGSDRLLLVTMVTRFGFDQTIDVTSATFGGVQLHEIVEGSSDATRNGVWMGYLLDSEIPDGEQSLSVSFTSTVSDPTGTKLLAATYVGVDQTTPVNDSSANNTKADAPITFGSQIDYVAGAEVVYVASYGGNTNTSTTEPAGYSKIYTNEWSGLLMTTIGHMDDTTTAGSSPGSTAVDFEGTDANHSLAVVALNPVSNAAPVVTATGTTLAYTENDTATTIDPSLSLSDADNSNLTGATVTISSNYVNGEDTLAFTDQLGITGSWDAGTGVLTLSGDASVADYQTALQSVTFVNSSEMPSALTRTVSFQVDDGTDLSNVATRDISVESVNDAPVILSMPASFAATEKVTLDLGGSISFTDPDAYTGSIEVTLSVVSGTLNLAPGINPVTVSGSGTNSITVTGNLTNVFNAVQGNGGASFTYINSSDNPPASDTLTVLIDDKGNTGSGGDKTDTANAVINITATNSGTAIWRDASTTPQTSDWNGSAFGLTTATAPSGDYRIMQGAEAPTRDEIIIIGVDESSKINGEIWNGSTWSVLPSGTLGSPLGTVSQNYWWSMDVAYEQQSGDAVMVWADGTELKSSVWNGSNWSVPVVVNDFGGSTPRQIQLAAQPNGDEMVMVVSDSNGDDTAWVWDGSSWTSQRSLDTSGGNLTSVYVSYEQQSGDALVTYAKSGDANVYYQIWGGTSWSTEASVTPPGGVTEAANWVTLGSDPGSDRIVMGVVTSGGTAADIWLSVWNGTSWETSVEAETTATGSVYPNVAVAFESTSGQALAAYGEDGSNTIKYRTWDNGSGWSTEQIGPDIGGEPNSLILAADPISDQIMLSAQDANSDVNYVLWDGSGWGTPTELGTSTTEVKNQPFLFLWDQAPGNFAPTFIDGAVGNWNFDEGSGDSATESAIGISTGTLGSTAGADANDPTWTTGKFGQALHFDGIDDYVEIADAPGLDISGPEFSASLWMNPDSGPNQEDMLFMKGDRQGNINYYLSWKNSNEMTWAFKDSAGWHYQDMAVTLPTTGQWNHIALTFDRPTVSLYVNGTKYVFDDVATGGSMDRDLTANNEVMWIGAGRDAGALVGVNQWSGPFTGSIDELALFDRALTDAEIEAIRTSTPPAVTASAFGIDENSANNTLVGTVVANDPDVGDTLTYAITAGNTNGAFAIDNNGVITVANSTALNFETTPSFNLTIQATDDGSPNLSDTTTVTIDLNDVVELLVTNTNATGTGSLYEAILNANANDGITDTITFDIPGAGPHVINLTGALPAITDTVIINGSSEPDYAGAPVVVLDGSAAGAVDGLTLAAGSDGSTIRGLVINNFQGHGILITNSSGNTIAGNYIGTDSTGLVDQGNGLGGFAGLMVTNGASNNTIGGLTAADRNVISGNGDDQIKLFATAGSGNTIIGNYIGLDADGNATLGNNGSGIDVQADGNTIGGTTAEERNVIADAQYNGIVVSGDDNVIQGNYIGTDKDGNATIDTRNGKNGVWIYGATGGGNNNLVGGTEADAGNLIHGNAWNGVMVSGGTPTGNTILGNTIYGNSLLGIDLNTTNNGDGVVTDNDLNDADGGPNSMQNFPLLTQADLLSTNLTLAGSLDTDGANTQYLIEFFGNTAGSQDTPNGEGRFYLGSVTVTTNGSGDASFSNVTLSGVALTGGDYVTATATRITDPGQVGVDDQQAYGNTSEFAVNLVITDVDTPATITGDVSFSGNEGDAVSGDLNATDVDGLADGTYFSVTTQAGNGTAAIDPATGAWTFTPADSNWFGTDQFTVTVTDDLGGGTTQVVSITLANVNDPPVISIDPSPILYLSGTMAVDPNLTVSDVDNATLQSAQVSFGDGYLRGQDRLLFTDQLGITGSFDLNTGILTLTGSASVGDYETALRSVQYDDFNPTPAEGLLYVNFSVSDGTDNSLVDTRVLEIVDNLPPRAADDFGTAAEGGSVVIDLAANDTDSDDSLDLTSIVITSGPASGNVVVNGDGTVTYTHNGSETASDTFTYTIKDTDGNLSNEAPVSITVTAVNDAPLVATNTGMTVSEGSTGTVITNLMLNEGDPDDSGAGLTYTVTSIPDYGTLRLNGTALAVNDTFTQADIDAGDLTFDHDGSQNFSDGFGFSLGDGGEDGAAPATDTFGITITNVDDPASIMGDTSFSGDEGDAVAGDLDATDVDGLADGTYFSVTTQATSGTAAIDIVTGAWTYTLADPNWFGSDNFTVTVTDDLGGTSTQVVNITLANVNDPVTAVDDSYSVSEDATFSSSSEWSDSNWSYSRTLSFDNSTRTENLVDFPVLVKLDSSVIDYAKTHDQGWDLRFFDQDGTALAHEVELWDEAGTSYVWVKIPQIDASSSVDSIVMYYGNAGVADSGENAAGVWSDYRAAYHLNENPGAAGTLADAAGNFDAVNAGSTDTAGVIGNAQDFNGVDQSINLGDDRNWINNASGATLSIWMNADTTTGSGDLIGLTRNDPADTGASRITLIRNGDDIMMIARTMDDSSDSVSVTTTTNPLAAGSWHHITGTVDYASDVDNIKIYVDGELEGTFSHNFTLDAIPNTDSSHAMIGADEDGISAFFDGQLDEARIADQMRSADWVSAQYAAMTGTLVDIGAEQTVQGVLINDVDADRDVLIVTELNGAPAAIGVATPLSPSGAIVTLNGDGSFTYDTNGAFESLGAGDSTTDSFTYTVIDGNGGVDTATVTMTITGVDDTPTIGGTDTGSVQEDVAVVTNNISTSGTLTIADPDTGESSFQAATVTGTYGSLTVATNGDWTYTADNTQAAIQALDVTEFITDTLTVTSFDGTTHNVVITIDGSEDAAVISGTTTGSVTEDGTLTSSGALTISDTDTSDTPSFADVGVTAGDNGYGTFEMTSGTWTYTLDNNNAAVQALDVSETLTDTHTFTASDGSTQQVTITINGAEDTPVFDSTAITAATEDVAYSYTITTGDVDVEAVTITAPTLPGWLTFVDNGNGTASLSGTPTNAEVGSHNVVLNVSDGTLSSNQSFTITVANTNDPAVIGGTDTGSVQEDVAVVTNNISTSGTLTIADPDTGESSFQAATVTGTYGSLTVATNGDWTYTADNTQAAIQALDVTESLTDTLTVTSFDGTTHNVVITINGSEDAAVIGGTTTGSVTEDGTLTSSGALTISDADTSDTPSFADVGVTAGDNGYGTFEMTSGTWTYTLDNNNAAVQALDVSETLTDTHTFTASDGSTQQVTITINGAEDTPVFDSTAITAATEDVAYSYTITTSDVDVEAVTITAPTLPGWLTFVDNGNGTASLSGTPTNAEVGNHNVVLNVSDGTLNSNQNFTIVVANTNDPAVIAGIDTGSVQEDVAVVTNNISTSGTLTIADPDTGESSFQAATINGTYGDLVMQTNGDWTYTADNTQAVIQQLDVTEFITDTLTVTSFDGTTHNVVITIDGSEDAAVIGGTTTGSVTEDGTLTSSGALTISDTDTSDTPSFADVGVTAGDNGYGTFEMTSGTWTYTLDNNNAAVQALDVSETLTDTHTFTASDGSTQQVTITINGAEDTPVFDSTAITAATEDVAYSYTITTSDVDVEAVTITAPTLPGWLTFVDNGNGTATLSGTPTNAEVGNHNVVLNVSDGTLSSNQNFTIIVANTNDPAVIAGVDTGSVQEDVAVVANNISTGGLLTITDPDTGESTFQAGTVNGTYGDLTIDTAGNWTYTADNTQAAIQQLDVTEFITDTLTVTSFDGTTHNVVITINGSEDASVISGTTTGSVTEDGTLTSSGLLVITDTDTSDPTSFADVTPQAGDNAHGTFEITSNTWTYILDNNDPAVQALDTGETLTDTHTFTAPDGVTQLVTVTINGAEDAPVFDSTAVTAATEDLAYSYTITTSDVDVESVVITAPTLPAWLTFVDNGNGTATLSGTPTNAEVGNHNVVLNVSDGTLSSNQNFTITVANTNDAAVIAGVDTGAVQEDVAVVANNISTGGLLTITDPDTGESTFQAGTVNGTYGDLTIDTAGNWTYTADNTQAAIQQLDVTEFITDTLTVTSFDGTTHNVVITINGSEDASVISGTTTGSVTEDGTLTSTGALVITDTDTSDPTSFVDVTPQAGDNAHGTFEITSNTWTYVLDNNDPAVQALDTGETLTDTYTFTAPDGVTQLVTVTINGAEDAPVFDSTAITAATEDLAYSYTITTSDVDVETVTITAPTLPGWLTFVDNGNGTATLSGTPTNAEVGSHNVVLNVSDGTLSSNQNFTITVANTNDPAVIGGTDTGSVQEDVAVVTNNISTSGTLTIADPDTGESSFQAATVTGTYGSLTVATNGDWTYTADNTQAAIQALDVTESLTDTLTVTSFDGTTHNVVITINGSEDAAVISGTTTGSVTEDGTLTSSGALTISDADTSDTPSFADVGVTAGDNGYGTFEMTSGTWTYTLDNNNAAVQALDVSETLTDTHTFTASDGSTQQVTITINGAEDTPVFDSTAITAATEDVAYSYTITTSDVDVEAVTITAPTLPGWLTFVDNGNGTASLSGTPTNAEVGNHNVVLNVSDGTLNSNQNFTIVVANTNDPAVIAGIDTGAVQEDVAIVANNISTGGLLTITDPDTGESTFQAGTVNGTYGDLTIDAAGNWTYTADNTQAVIQQLDVTEFITDTLTVTSFDGTTHNVVITINGSEDASVISGTTTGSVTEDGTLTSSGLLTITDTDTSDPTSFVDVTPQAGDNAHGTFEITANTWTYILDNNDPAVQALDTGETLTDTYTFTAPDGVTQLVTVTINGAEDAPVFDSTAITAATEDLAYSYTITTSDVDVETVTITAPTLPGWLTFVDNGNGTATLSGTPTNAEVGNHNVVLNVSDGTLSSNQNFTIIVANTNDPAVIAGVDTGSVQEDVAVVANNISTGGLLTITDPDTGESTFQAGTVNGTYGDLTIDAAGNWTYTADNTQAVIQQLDVTEFITDTLTVTSFDGTTHNVVITINGSEDASVISGTTTGSVTEDGTLTSSGLLVITDTDTSDPTSFADVTPQAGDNAHGTFEITANTWTYILDNNDPAVQALDTGETLTDTYTFTAPDGVTQLVTVTINGAEDAPVFDSTAITAATEDLAYSYTITTSDVDVETVTITAPTLPGWLTFVDNGNGTATLSGTPTNAEVGNHNVVLNVSDGTLSSNQNFTIIVANTNDPAVIAGVDTGSVQEDVAVVANNISTGGLLTITDPDTGESTFQAGTVNGTYGDLTIDTAGNWTYTADNTQAAIQQLDVTEFITDTLTVTSFDGTTHNVVITINGSEDASVISGTTTGSVTEDGTLTSSGLLVITDTDTSDPTSFADVTPQAGDNAHGTFEITSNTWTYILDNNDPAVQALDTGETLTDTHTFTAPDGVTQLVTVTINGAEDAPVFDSTAVTAATEDLAYSYTITTSDMDVESVVITAPTLPAWLTFVDNGNGTATLSGTPTNAEVGNHNVVLNVSDGTLSSNQNFTITVANTNDAAVIAGVDTGAVQEDVAVVANNISTGGLLTITDPDTGESTFQAGTVNGTYGDLTIDTAGNWTYTADNTQAAIQQLDVTEFITDTLTVTSFDGTTHNVVITINGSEDASVISGTTTGSVTEDGTLTSTGALVITDTDTSDPTSFVDVTPQAGDNAHGTFEITSNTWTYVLDNNDPAVQALDTGETLTDTYTFTAPDGVTQLVTVTINGAEDAPVFDSTAVTAATEDLAYSYTITTSDVDIESVTITAPTLPGWLTFVDNGNGTATLSGTPTNAEVGNHNVVLNVSDGTLSSNQNFTIIVANTNDPAVIAGVDTGAVQEDVAVVANNISTGGLLTITDPDTGESTFQAGTVNGTYGDLTIDTAGNWTYTADNTQAAIQQLDVTEFITDTLTVTSFDGTTHNVVITINGSEDAAVIGGVAVGIVTEDGALIASDTLSITDVDTNDNPIGFNDVAPTLGINGYGTFEITANAWNYTLNNGHAAVQALGAGDALNDIFTFVATDGSTRVVTVTINGANDAPVIGGTSTGAVAEDVAVTAGNLLDSGSLSIADPDTGESGFLATTINGTYGDLTIDAAGNWSYSADNSQSAIQSLQAGESVSDTLTVTTADGSTHDVVITIIGARDAAPPPAPPPPEPPPEDEPPVDEQIDEIVEEQGGTGDDPILEEIVQVAQDIRTPAPEEDSSFAQPDEAESEPVNYGPAIDKQAPKMPEQPQPQALQAQNLSIDTLTLQVSDDEALNEQYELELLGRIDSMHLGMDDEAAQQNADDVNVQIFVGSTASLTVGIVSWVLRGGALLASFMSTVPLLNRFDPLPILKAREDEEDVEPDEDDDEKTQVREHARKVDNMFSGKGDSQQ